MKMKKIIGIAVSAVLLVSIAAAGAFAADIGPSSPTSTDKDAGKTDISISGEGEVADTKPAEGKKEESLYVEVKTTEDSQKEEEDLRSDGMQDYLGTDVIEKAADIMDTSKENVTVSEIKEVIASGYDEKMEEVTLKVPFAALPEEGTKVAVVVRVSTPDGKTVSLPVEGIVVEETVIVNGVARKVRKVMFTLDGVTMQNVVAGKVYVAAVTRK